MYDIIIYVKNKENPIYKEMLKKKSLDIFGLDDTLNSILGIQPHLNMNEEYGDQFAQFCIISGFSQEITLESLHKLIELYQSELKKRFGINEITYRIDLSSNRIDTNKDSKDSKENTFDLTSVFSKN